MSGRFLQVNIPVAAVAVVEVENLVISSRGRGSMAEEASYTYCCGVGIDKTWWKESTLKAQ